MIETNRYVVSKRVKFTKSDYGDSVHSGKIGTFDVDQFLTVYDYSDKSDAMSVIILSQFGNKVVRRYATEGRSEISARVKAVKKR